MSFLHLADKIRLRFGRYKVGAPTTNSQPGAHTGNSRQYIPGYSDSNIVYLDTVSGNDANDGSTELLAKLTYASAATAAGSTKKIRVINDGATLSTNITKPTEMKWGVSGTIAPATSALATWAQASAPSFGATDVYCVAANDAGRIVAGGGSGKLAYSDDGGDTWTQGTGLAASEINDVIYDRYYGKWYAASSRSVLISSDGAAWVSYGLPAIGVFNAVVSNHQGAVHLMGASAQVFVSYDGQTFAESGYDNITLDSTKEWAKAIYNESESRYVAGLASSSGTVHTLYYSADAVTWTACTVPSFVGSLNAGVYAPTGITVFVAGGGAALVSSDGITFTANSSGVATPYSVAYSPAHSKFIIVGASGNATFSADYTAGNTSFTSSFGSTTIYDAAYDKKSGRLIAVGFSGKIARSNAVAANVQASIAGFTLTECGFSSGVSLYSCTANELTATNTISLYACRARSAWIDADTITVFASLFEGDVSLTATPASANAVAINCNTFAGNVYLYNSSATGYEQIRDNVIVGDFTASFAAPMLSGNLQGTNTNGILAKAVTLSDPAFVNTTDYKLKRLTNGDSQDSPLCNAAVYYVNEQGQPRDMGAWSEDDSENAIDYRYSYFIDKPAGNGIRPQKIVAASADQGMDGTWDSVNEPERASEYLTITYSAAVSREHVVIQDLLESLIDMTCEVSLTPDLSDPDTAVTVNGNHSIGDIVLNIDASSTIKAGMVLPIGGVNYFILYTASGSSPTKLVLHKPLESAVSDNTVITPQEPAAYGTYQYIPQSREIPRPTKMETDYVNGVSFKFVRQYPQV
jgi:hypothetical protein